MASTSNPNPCSHLSTYREKHGLKAYRSLQTRLQKPANGRRTRIRLQSPIPRCRFCSQSRGRIYQCLICSSLSCSDHFPLHLESNPGHDIAVDMERAELFCFACFDQVYDPDFDSGKKIKRPGKERNLPTLPWGLRGLNNLGNTCFLNSVLQALLHAPPLRNYFLDGRHNREVCRQKRRRRTAAASGESSCLACDVDGVFAAVFSGDRTPYSPARFLFSWWQHSSNLSGYEQQDAHEFFISMLDRIHEKEQSCFPNKGIGDCHCIAHRVFSGVLRSDVTCTICGYTSTTYDPCVDISLDLEPSNENSRASGKAIKSKDNPIASTLIGCLDLFTRPEKLGSDQKLYCQHCQVRQDSVKQMSIRRLPLVLCFHIKRFEHSFIQRTSRKIDRNLNFPFSLDMTPYLSSSIIRNRFGSRVFAFEGDESEMSSELSSEFEVFAVVTHSGGLESGHYVTYLRLRDQWYKCDDAWILQVNEGAVRAAQGYLVYYVQKVLYYRAGEEMNHFPASTCC